MTRYYVIKNKTDEFFKYGSLYYTDSTKMSGDMLLLTPHDKNDNNQQVIVPFSHLVEIDKEQFDLIEGVSPISKICFVNEIIRENTSTKIGVFRKGYDVLPSGEEIPAIYNFSVSISGPLGGTPTSLTKEDVLGGFVHKSLTKLSDGMIVARSDQECPHFEDTVPYKSVTVVCDENQEKDVHYWLEYVHGANSVSMKKPLPNNRIALRSDYQCW
jgi:hypothetical protein